MVARCEGYDTGYTAAGAVAAGAGFLAGAGGVSTLGFDDKDQDARVGIGIASLAVGTLSAVVTFIASNQAKNFAEHDCPDVFRRAREKEKIKEE